MAGQKHRTQILLEPEQHKALVEIAQQERRSISDIVRRIISQHLKERTKDAKRQRAIEALGRLICLREKIEQRSGVYQGDLIAEARAERDEQMERVWSGGRR
jgi:predicted DNA-binding ribbon-helix-helix protein